MSAHGSLCSEAIPGRRFLNCVLALYLTTQALSAADSPDLIFSQFVNGGAGGPNTTRIILRSHHPVAVAGRVLFRSGKGALIQVPQGGKLVDTIEFNIAPWATLEIETDGTGDLVSGVIEVYIDDADASALEGTEVFSLLGKFVSVPNSKPGTSSQIYISRNSEENSGIAIYNPDEVQPVTVEGFLLDDGGNQKANTEFIIPPQNQLVAFVDEEEFFQDYFEANPGIFSGTLNLHVKQGEGFSSIGLIQKLFDGALIAASGSEIAFNPGLAMFNLNNFSIRVVKAANLELIKDFSYDAQPVGMAFSPDGKSIYVSILWWYGSGPGRIEVIDRDSLEVTATVDRFLQQVTSLTVSPDGKYLYAPDAASGTLNIIETESLAMVGLGIGRGKDVVFTPAGDFAYVTVGGTGVVVIDTASKTIDQWIYIGDSEGITITPDGELIYVAQPGQVAVIEVSTNTHLTTLPTEAEPGNSFFGLGIGANIVATPDGRFIYRSLTCCGTVVVIERETNEVVEKVDVGASTHGLAFSPDGRFLYIASGTGAKIFVLQIFTNTVIGTISAGFATSVVAVSPI